MRGGGVGRRGVKRLGLLLAAASVTLTAACTSGLTEVSQAGGAADRTPVTLQVWSFFTGREKGFLDADFAAFHKQYPWITVDSVGNQSDTTMVQATRGGNPPDLALSASSSATPSYCASGVWQDLTPFIDRDHVDLGKLLPATLTYTTGDGKRCAFPLLTDAYAMYYNTAMLKAAGYTSAPRTWAELTAMAKKLTVRKPDGTIVRAGFIPSFSYYENNAESFTPQWGLKWYTAQDTSAVASDPAWAAMLRWQQSLVDWYGYDHLTRFVAGLGNEFSPGNAFEQGKVAMNVDGEWRVAFITADKSTVHYRIAPMPQVDPAKYGSGLLGGTTMGIPNGAHHPQASWLLERFLAFDTPGMDALANGLENIPSTKAALANPSVHTNANFNELLEIGANRYSESVPGNAAGTAPEDTVGEFLQEWEAGSVGNLADGLKSAASEIDAQLDQSAEGNAP